jgi:hypothetical protein
LHYPQTLSYYISLACLHPKQSGMHWHAKGYKFINLIHCCSSFKGRHFCIYVWFWLLPSPPKKTVYLLPYFNIIIWISVSFWNKVL